MEKFLEIVTLVNGKLNAFAWGPIMLALLIGTGVYLTIRTRCVQVTKFGYIMKHTVGSLFSKKNKTDGKNLTAFQAVSTTMAGTVGTGNIAGVTGAIFVGGPGAVFWMWVSAFFGMAVAYMEAVLAQIFKEKKDDEFVGGLPFYGRKLLGNKGFVGVFLSLLYILYALCCLPAQGFNVVSSVGRMAEIVTGSAIATDSAFYYIVGAITIVLTFFAVFGGIRKVTKWTDRMVPVMAVLYVVTVLVLILMNLNTVPYFFKAVFGGAFQPDAVFGGMFGTVLAQGVKRGLMSNEAGQGTITMSAAAADAKHPCEQGLLSAIGVFLDTMVICTLTGFVVVMAHCWNGPNAEAWAAMDKLPKFTESLAVLTPGTSFNAVVTFVITLCFCLFAYTCLLGMISFSEIAANRIRKDKAFINGVRIIGLIVAAFGILCNIAGLELGNLWAFSDLGNILIVFFNVPIVYVGAKYVLRAAKHYEKNDGTPFTSATIGRDDCQYWDEKAKN